MKIVHYIGAGAAVFIGVLAAMQVSKQIDRTPEEQPLATFSRPEPIAIVPAQLGPGSVDFRSAAKRVNQSVVSIDRFERYETFFGESVGEQETGSGSGVVIGADGIVVTNNHVVAGASRVQVRTNEGKSYDAKVLGTDSVSDIAVLKIEGVKLAPIAIGDSKTVQVGQWVMAVGNPLGFDNTVSVGVVSSLKRSLPIQGTALVDAIQTDAAINPGNSGGALTDAEGKLIGINTAIASNNQGSVGIGFAVPVNRVQKVVGDIIKFGYAQYPGLGVSYKPEWDGVLAFRNVRRQVSQQVGATNVPSYGIIIAGSQGDAAAKGLKQWDILLEIDGERINGAFDLNRVLVPKKPGDVVNVKFWSKGQEKTARILLQEIRREA
jgi:S1-C subfamily serine protease